MPVVAVSVSHVSQGDSLCNEACSKSFDGSSHSIQPLSLNVNYCPASSPKQISQTKSHGGLWSKSEKHFGHDTGSPYSTYKETEASS